MRPTHFLLCLLLTGCAPCLPQQEEETPSEGREAPTPVGPQVWEPPPYLMCEAWGYACEPSDDPALQAREAEIRQELTQRRYGEGQDFSEIATWLRELPDIGGVTHVEGGNLSFWLEGGQPFFYATIKEEIDVSALDDMPQWDGDFDALRTRQQPLVVHHEEWREKKRALILSPLWWWGGSTFRKAGDAFVELLGETRGYKEQGSIIHHYKNDAVGPNGPGLTGWIDYDTIAIDTHGVHEFRANPNNHSVQGFLMATGVFQSPPKLKEIVKTTNMNQSPGQDIAEAIKDYVRSTDGKAELTLYDQELCGELEDKKREDPVWWRGVHCFSLDFTFTYTQGDSAMRRIINIPAVTLGVSADYFAPKERRMRPLKNKFVLLNACESGEGEGWLKPIVDDATTVVVGWTTPVLVGDSTDVAINVLKKMIHGMSFKRAAELLGDVSAPTKYSAKQREESRKKGIVLPAKGDLVKISGKDTEQRIREIITLLDDDGEVELEAGIDPIRLQGATKRDLPLVVQVDGITTDEALGAYTINVYAAEQGKPVGAALQKRAVTLADARAKETEGPEDTRVFKVPVTLALSPTQARDPALELVAIVDLPEGGDSRDPAVAPLESDCPSWEFIAFSSDAEGTDGFVGNHVNIELTGSAGFAILANQAYRDGDGLLQLRSPAMSLISTQTWQGAGDYAIEAITATRAEGGDSSYVSETPIMITVTETAPKRYVMSFTGVAKYISDTSVSDVSVNGGASQMVLTSDEPLNDGCY